MATPTTHSVSAEARSEFWKQAGRPRLQTFPVKKSSFWRDPKRYFFKLWVLSLLVGLVINTTIGWTVAVRVPQIDLPLRPVRVVTPTLVFEGVQTSDEDFARRIDWRCSPRGDAELNNIGVPPHWSVLHNPARASKLYQDAVAAMGGSRIAGNAGATIIEVGSGAGLVSRFFDATGRAMIPAGEANQLGSDGKESTASSAAANVNTAPYLCLSGIPLEGTVIAPDGTQRAVPRALPVSLSFNGVGNVCFYLILCLSAGTIVSRLNQWLRLWAV